LIFFISSIDDYAKIGLFIRTCFKNSGLLFGVSDHDLHKKEPLE